MLPLNFNNQDGPQPVHWREISDGVPTLTGLATLCSRNLAGLTTPVAQLSLEAQAILYQARQRGMIELQNHAELFDSSDRLLAIIVELPEQKRWMFKRHAQPRTTQLFLEGFRQLCQSGLVIHQSHKEFSLTAAGFERADSIDPQTLTTQLAYGQELDA